MPGVAQEGCERIGRVEHKSPIAQVSARVVGQSFLPRITRPVYRSSLTVVAIAKFVIPAPTTYLHFPLSSLFAVEKQYLIWVFSFSPLPLQGEASIGHILYYTSHDFSTVELLPSCCAFTYLRL